MAKKRALKRGLKAVRAEAERWKAEACGAKAVLNEIEIELYMVKRERDFLIKRLGAADDVIAWHTPHITPCELKARPLHPLHEYLKLIKNTVFTDPDTLVKEVPEPKRRSETGEMSR